MRVDIEARPYGATAIPAAIALGPFQRIHIGIVHTQRAAFDQPRRVVRPSEKITSLVIGDQSVDGIVVPREILAIQQTFRI